MPTAQELIAAARETIGDSKSDTDWRIVPTEHATEFAGKGASLAQNLRRSRCEGLAKMYEDQNARAVKARDAFKRTVSRADTAVFCTASLAALLMVAGGLQEYLGDAGRWIVGAIGALGVVSAGLAAMWLNQVRGGELAQRWTGERAKAEAKRLAYFKTVMEGASAEPSDQLLVLEYTRRFLLDNQIDFFRGRGEQHEGAATAALHRSTLALFAASTFTAVAGLLSMLVPPLALTAGVGVIASAYAALVLSRSAVNMDRKNADRYQNTATQLEERRLDLDAYRERAAAGDQAAVTEFFEPVFVTLESDHKGYLSDAEQREAAIGEMAQRLDSAKESLDRKGGAGT
jgi:hypothetical protein